jgi:glycosyltransferase involved in cell wall biosynthesis
MRNNNNYTLQFIFWQNILSIHQSAFIRALAERHQVTLVTEEEVSSDRIAQGWHAPDFGLAKLIVAPDFAVVSKLINNNIQSIHVFSGFFGGPIIRIAYQKAFALKIKPYFILEPFDVHGVKGILRFIKYSVFIRQHKCNIKGLLATGKKACYLYQGCGFPLDKVFSWGYFTEMPLKQNKISLVLGNHSLPHLVYVGQFIPRKNVLFLINSLKELEGLFHKATFIGGGVLKEEIDLLSRAYPWLEIKPFLPNRELLYELYNKDLLILPSRFDGWGAVVNEALQAGVPVIASENCGAASLLDGEYRGEVFMLSQKNNLKTVLKKWLAKGKMTSPERQKIQNWASQNISSEAATTYFLQICEYLEKTKKEKPKAPWL